MRLPRRSQPQKAEAYRVEVTEKAKREADRFRKMAAETAGDRTGRELTVKRLLLETMEGMLPRLKTGVPYATTVFRDTTREAIEDQAGKQ